MNGKPYHSSYRAYTPAERKQLQRRKRMKRLAGFVICGLLAFGAYRVLANKKPDSDGSNSILNLSKVLPSSSPTPTPTPTPKPVDSTALRAGLDAVVAEHPELSIGVSFTDLGTDTHVDVNGDKQFVAASTNKMVAAYTFLKQVEEGKHSLSEKLDGSPASYHLKQMINQSNNYSWELFIKAVTYKGEDEYAQAAGFSGYKSIGNLMSPNSMTSLLEKLYKGTLLSNEHRDLVLSYMQNTNEETILPPALPKDAVFYHKWGEYEDNVHDVVIVSHDGYTYVLSVYTNGKGVYQYEARKKVIQELGAVVVEELQKK